MVLSYCHNSLNDSSLAAELLYFEDKGVGVISASPLSMGLLTKVRSGGKRNYSLFVMRSCPPC